MIGVYPSFYPSDYFSPLLNRLSTTSALSKLSRVKEIFYEHSLLFAMDNQAIKEKFQQYKDLSWTQKFQMGAIKGAENVLISFVFIMSLNLVLMGMASGHKAESEIPSVLVGVAVAIFEEVLFRGILQNCLAGSQKVATYITPQCLQNNRVFQWLISPSARIISINALFAGLHLTNGGTYISDKGSLIQATRLLVLPIFGILHETTGNIMAPVACHMAMNFVALSIANLGQALVKQ